MTDELIDGIGAYLIQRAPYDPHARALYNRLIVEVNHRSTATVDHEGGSPGEDVVVPAEDVID